MPSHPRVRRLRALGSALVVLALATGSLLTGCSSGGGDAAPTTTSSPATSGAVPRAGTALADAFSTVTVRVTLPDGSVREFCLWLAADDQERQRGLMFVTDPGLEGRPGMLSRFDRDVQGGFWMRNTRLPLSIAYVAADGRPVTLVDMDPCPDRETTCPTYGAAAPYRYAIEVPEGQLDELGITPEARIEVGAEGCGSGAPATSAVAASLSDPVGRMADVGPTPASH